MTDVEFGGGTVFPYLNILVKARKGMAAFWWNLSTSGEGEFYTRHAACPVVVGKLINYFHNLESNKS